MKPYLATWEWRNCFTVVSLQGEAPAQAFLFNPHLPRESLCSQLSTVWASFVGISHSAALFFPIRRNWMWSPQSLAQSSSGTQSPTVVVMKPPIPRR